MIRNLLCLSLAVCACGCARKTVSDPDIMTRTHKVWRGEDYLEYQNSRGFGCGNIERQNNGWIYHAAVIDWNMDHKEDREPTTDWNNLQDAERWVEQWCKP